MGHLADERPLPFRLMIITDEGEQLVARVRAALDGAEGRRVAIQMRRKREDQAERRRTAEALRQLTRERGALLLINTDVTLARDVGADGVHLPAAMLRSPTAWTERPAGQCVGASCHDLAQLDAAAQGGASYALVSPVHDVADKGPSLGIVGFRALTHQAKLPVLALGGVAASDIPALFDAGARGVAVIRAVLAADDPARATAELLDALAAGPINGPKSR